MTANAMFDVESGHQVHSCREVIAHNSRELAAILGLSTADHAALGNLVGVSTDLLLRLLGALGGGGGE